jgi:hypothetical protein
MLRLMDCFGAGLLYLFLFRKEAWTDESVDARRTRLVVSAATLGFVLGLLFYVKWPGVVWFSNDNGTKAWFSFAGVPLVLIAITFLLESLNKRFK